MNYSEAIQFLYDLRLFGAKFGLENTFKLAELMGNPQNRLRFIHVAGTNGKGSTCAMLESIYRAAGLRVGLFTSPHLVSFRERIQVNRELIGEDDVVRLVEELRAKSSAGFQPAGLTSVPDRSFQTGGTDAAPTRTQEACTALHPTFFEAVTMMALKHFAEQQCDVVIWETGLGGRLDATNIVTPLASVITNISFDHQQWLGNTLAEIAAEKAGIIKPGIPVITATDVPEALAVIEKMAQARHAPLTKVNSEFRIPNSELSLLGEHQKVNAGLALATVEVLQKHIPVAGEAIQTGLRTINWAGRLQLVSLPDGRRILLDGAHNVAGAKALRESLFGFFPLPANRGEGRGEGQIKRASSPRPSPPFEEERERTSAMRRTLILGVLRDKDWRHICETLAPLAGRIFTVPVSSERSADPAELAAACRAANAPAEISACPSLRDALDKIADDDFVAITGSLYLVGEALELLGLSQANGSERGLNEWTAIASVH